LVYYPFNGNINDESGNNRNLSGTAVYISDRYGNANNALRINSSSNILSHSSAAYHDMDSNFTINFWINSQAPTSSSFPLFWGHGYGGGNDESYFVEYRSNMPGLAVANRAYLKLDDGASCNITSEIADSTYKISSWEMITITRNQTTLSLYQDTVLVQTVALSPSCIQANQLFSPLSLYLGSSNSNELVDDVMLFNRLLTSEEISYLYNLTSSYTVSPTSLSLIEQSSFEVFPNPISETFNIRFEKISDYLIDVADLTGKIIYSTKFNGQQLQINSGDWATGIYLLTVSSDNGKRETVKIIR
jgi:hypothetical protein